MSTVLSGVAWPYAKPLHIGHIAGFGIPSDVFSRYMRLAGHDVLMVSGTDEHGTPTLVQADAEGVTPREVVDRYNRVIVEDLTALGLSYDLFTRTSTVNHEHVVQELFLGVHANGYMIEQTSLSAISPSTGRTLPDRFIEGTCPLCKSPGARGDQCDNCGNQLDAIDLIEPRSKLNGETPQFVDSTQFFLDLPALADAVGQWLEERDRNGNWRPNVIKFSRNLVKDVRPRAMTRDIDWGIRIPLDGWKELDTKRFYVWFDAVIGYLSASIEWARRQGEPEAWRKWWNDPEALSYYFMGKDNITFHSQIWPSELLGYMGKGAKGGSVGRLGELNLPTEVVSSEYLQVEGAKFSTSRGVVLYIRDLLERYQPDAIRYFICAAGPENQDTDFTWAEFVRRINDELVAAWGNLVNRTASLVHKNLGHIPEAGELQPEDHALLAATAAGFDTVGGLLREHKLRQGIAEAMRVVAEVNKYLADTAPWALKKTDPQRMATVLHVAVQAISDCNTILSPFLPHSSQRVHELFGRTSVLAPQPVVEEVADLDGGPGYPIITGDYRNPHPWRSVPIEAGVAIAAPAPIFVKLDPNIIDEELARMGLGQESDSEQV